LREINNSGDFKEAEHPRDNDGKFTSGGSSSNDIKSADNKTAKEDKSVNNVEKQKQEIISRLDKDFVEAADKMFEDAKNNKGLNKLDEKAYQKVDKEEVAKIKEKTGLDIEGYEHKITNYDIRKIYKDHGKSSVEEPRGQKAITKDDVKLIPEITRNYDSVELTDKLSENKQVLKYTKKIGDLYFYLETVGGKNSRDLRPKTMYIRKQKR
jgi:hypothetical protein